MSIEERYLPDFSGGEILLKSSIEPQDNQWLSLKGFILDSNSRLRSQWLGKVWVLEDESS